MSDSVKIEIMTITPMMAKMWLLKNTNNRKLRKEVVTRMATAIKLGQWKMTGDAIRFSTKRLIDGQHRLMAIVAAGHPVTSVVMSDIDDEAFDYIDQGNRRTAADVITSHGIAYAATCSAMYKMITGYEKGGATLHQQGSEIMSCATIVAGITEAHALSAKFGKSCEIVGVCPGSLIATFHYLTLAIKPELADCFWETLGTGKQSMFLSTSNAMLLRDRLLCHAAANKKMTIEHKFTWAVRAWNAERADVNLASNGLKFVAGDPIPRFE
jgi:hypothetical protein